MILEILAAEYPLFYLNPDQDDQQTYRRVVLQGDEPQTKSLAHYYGDEYDCIETEDTPAGPVRVIVLGNRHDFELVIRGLMAARSGPKKEVLPSQGAAMLTVFNWAKINAHLSSFPEEEQDEEFRRFTSVKENYVDMLVVLSRGPYSHIDAAQAGHSEEEWLALSDTIRRYHELTHVICRRLYPDDIKTIRDELIADAVGLYAAYGQFDPEKVKLFLGIRDGQYVGGRLENYSKEPEKLTEQITAMLEQMKILIDAIPDAKPFDLIPVLMRNL